MNVPTLLPGSTIKCVRNKTSKPYPITPNNVYEVVEQNKKGTFDGVIIKNDLGKKAKYKLKYFVVIKEISVEEYAEKYLDW